MKVDAAFIDAVKIHAVRTGRSVSDLVRDLLAREIGWGVRDMVSLPADRIREVLDGYGNGKSSRADAMAALGMDAGDARAFARLMAEARVEWPPVDRAKAETEAERLIEAMAEGDAS